MPLFTRRMVPFPLYFMLVNCSLPPSPVITADTLSLRGAWHLALLCGRNSQEVLALLLMAGGAHCGVLGLKHVGGWIVFGSQGALFLWGRLCHVPFETL